MTKKILAVAALVFLFLVVMYLQQQQTKNLNLSRKDKNAPESEAAISASPQVAEQKVDLQKKETLQEQFKKCFQKEITGADLEAALLGLKKQRTFSEPNITEERYELVSAEKKEWVVQVLPLEEEKNKVRVFSVNPEDGLPDRIKDFPYANSEKTKKLEGALSLGQLKNKTVSTTQTSYDGSLLVLDKTNEKLVRIHFMANSFDFECKNQNCVCLMK